MFEYIKMWLIARKYPQKADDFWNDRPFMDSNIGYIGLDHEIKQFCSEFSWKHLLGLE